MKKVALISCVKDKLPYPSKAIDLYCSYEFKKWLKDARDRQADDLYILSGKHGLIATDTIIEPYDFNLSEANPQKRKEWTQKVLAELRTKHDLSNTHFIIYANSHYYEYLVTAFSSYEVPFIID